MVLALPAQTEVGVVQPHELTLILDVAPGHSVASIGEMKRELTTVMREAPYELSFRNLKELRAGEEFRDVVVVRLNGTCQMTLHPTGRPGTGTLAFTHSSDGEILPFAEVSCDAVRASVRAALRGDQFRHADRLFGRALGRVLAHELYHVCAKTARHGSGGIARTTLSGDQLIGETLEFEPEDLDRFKRPEPQSVAGGGI
jgi:hypothetical protein